MSQDSSDWVSLRRAAEILGVHPATVRNWADKGEIASRRTPGGHRRFLKSDLLQHIEREDDIQPIEVQVIIQNALGQTRMEIGDGNLEDLPWYAAMSEKTRHAMRAKGRKLLEALRVYLASGAPDEKLSDAIRLGEEYAVVLVQDGLTLPQAMRGFFYFSEFVVNSILTWSEITPPRNTSEWATLLRYVNNFMNVMLLSLVEYYEEE
ncbi:MAG: helix-turn-helix domain-containing protein [Phototrophicales bacterium]